MCYSRLLIVLLFSFLYFPLNSQYIPKGVTLLENGQERASFLYKDSRNNLWMGMGYLKADGTRADMGLRHYTSNTWITDFTNGQFTDAIERSGKVYFTSYKGIYVYDGSAFTLDNTWMNNTCIVSHQNSLFIGSLGDGLHRIINSYHINVPLKVGAATVRNIYSLCSDGKYLWLGTSMGLLRYDGHNCVQFPAKSAPAQDSMKMDVLSVKRDGRGDIWITTRASFRHESLFRLSHDTFETVREYVGNTCYREEDVPRYAQQLSVSREGNILVGLVTGILEVTPYGFRRYYANLPLPPNAYLSINAIGRYGTAVHCDRSGMIYGTGGFPAMFDPGSYSHEGLDDASKRHMAQHSLDINDIKAGFSNVGTLFNSTDPVWNFLRRPVFDIPSIGCAKSMYSSALWAGGLDDSSQLHMAAEQYGITGNFLPGPIDTVNGQYDSVAAVAYNRIWKVSRFQVDEFRTNYNKPGYTIPTDILEWPAHGKSRFSRHLAPFVDVDKNGIYEPAKGDYPKIKGDQMLWCVFNDLGTKVDSFTKPIGIEIHASYYAYHCADYTADDSAYILNRTIFCEYQVVNRSGNNYKDFRLGIFNDVDLGNYADDYVGCYVPGNAGYGYNGDANDEGRLGFGTNPPVMICKFLNKKMDAFMYYNNSFSPVQGAPRASIDYYNYTRARWKNGASVKYGATGLNGTIDTRYMFDNGSNPATASQPKWSEGNAGDMPGDRRYVMSTGDMTLKADSSVNLEFAYMLVYKPGIDLFAHFNEQPLQAMRMVQQWYDGYSFPACTQLETGIDPVNGHSAQAIHVYPNPANEELYVELSGNMQALGGVEIIDLLGKRVAYVPTLEQGRFTVSLDGLPQGVYFARVLGGNGWLTMKFVRL